MQYFEQLDPSLELISQLGTLVLSFFTEMLNFPFNTISVLFIT